MNGHKAVYAVFMLLAAVAPVRADAAPPSESSPLLAGLLKCEDIADDAPRLRCLDAATRAIRQAAASGQVALIDREKVNSARRSLFGFDRHIPVAGDSSGIGEMPTEIKTTVKAATDAGYGNWLIVVAEGASWVTLETQPIFPKAGMPVVIRRNGFGGYLMTVDGRTLLVKRRR